MYSCTHLLNKNKICILKKTHLKVASPLKKEAVDQTFKSHTCPSRPDSRTPAASLMRGWNTPPLCTLPFSHPSIFYFSLPVCPQLQSSCLVICDLPVCRCNKVSAQLRIHFPGTNATNHSLESLDTHTHTHKLRLTQIKLYTNGNMK